jgi:benzylsuccinate CoA-transferase BbsF subunit
VHPRFQSLESRQQNVDALDALVDAWTSQRKAEDVMELLQAAGVAAGVVQDARDLHADPQLKHRGHYAVLDHPETGPATYDSPAYKLSRTPARFHMPAPCLGEHNQFICSELLGISDERFVELLEEGVFE